jgi:hypothetical protein
MEDIMKTLLNKYMAWSCMALAAAFLVAGTPGQSHAAFNLGTASGSDLAVISDILAFGAAVGVCGDYKGGECSEKGEVQKCKSKNGDKLCQTCDSYPHCPKGVTYCWGSGSKGDCWDDKTISVQDSTVLERF